MKIKYLECDCHSPEHTLRFSYFEDEPDTLFIEPHLYNYQKWYQRLWAAIKYVFGHCSNYGHFDCIVLDIKKSRELAAELDEFIFLAENYNAKNN